MNETMVTWLMNKEKALQIDDTGLITQKSPPLVATFNEQQALINELKFLRQEGMQIPYDLSEEDWHYIDSYAIQYSDFYLYGNDSLVKLASTSMFRDIV